ncbi:MAG: oligosaccharide flippase family protein [Planctomycetota bacterium]
MTKPTDRNFRMDVVWVLGSLVVAGLGGVAVNTIIAARMGSSALGVFNQAFAFYIVLSQLAVGGLQYSVLHQVSRRQDDLDHASRAASSAMMLVGTVSLAVCLLAWLARGVVGRLLSSPDVADAIGYMLPGLFAFSLNKLLLNVLSGLRHMRAYAVFQSLRFVLLLGSIAALVAMGRPGSHLTIALSVSELLLFVGLVAYIRLALFRFQFGGSLAAWYPTHISYGLRGFLSGVLHELNTRVDILILGFFRDDATVGIYSFAAILAEGFAQIPLALRTNVDPIIGGHLANQRKPDIEAFSRRLSQTFFPLMLAVGAAAVVVYPFALGWIRVDASFQASWVVFGILVAGISLNARYRPFMGILLQSGHPGSHTVLVAIVVLSNLILNVALVPAFGAPGSAVATGTAFLVEAALIAILARRMVGVRL